MQAVVPEESSTAVIDRVSAKRRLKRRGNLNLRRSANVAMSQPRETDIWQGDKQAMRRIVGEYVKVRFERMITNERRHYPELTTANELVSEMAARGVTMLTVAELQVLSLLMEQTRQRTHCSTQTIAKFVLQSVKRDYRSCSVTAYIDKHGDLILATDM